MNLKPAILTIQFLLSTEFESERTARMSKPRLNRIYSIYVATVVLFLAITVLTIFWAGYGTILAEIAEPQRQQVLTIFSRYHNEIALGQSDGLEENLKLQLVRLASIFIPVNRQYDGANPVAAKFLQSRLQYIPLIGN
jgi:hypothetical protein